jgi:hypothetical protein
MVQDYCSGKQAIKYAVRCRLSFLFSDRVLGTDSACCQLLLQLMSEHLASTLQANQSKTKTQHASPISDIVVRASYHLYRPRREIERNSVVGPGILQYHVLWNAVKYTEKKADGV